MLVVWRQSQLKEPAIRWMPVIASKLIISDPILIEVTSGAAVESRHRGAIVVVDAAGRRRAAIGNVEQAVFPRSAVKALEHEALLVRVLFVDARLGAVSMEKADFSAAHLVDVSLRGANLMGASFARATLIGVDLRDAALSGADFSGSTAIGCHFPAGFTP